MAEDAVLQRMVFSDLLKVPKISGIGSEEVNGLAKDEILGDQANRVSDLFLMVDVGVSDDSQKIRLTAFLTGKRAPIRAENPPEDPGKEVLWALIVPDGFMAMPPKAPGRAISEH